LTVTATLFVFFSTSATYFFSLDNAVALLFSILYSCTNYSLSNFLTYSNWYFYLRQTLVPIIMLYLFSFLSLLSALGFGQDSKIYLYCCYITTRSYFFLPRVLSSFPRIFLFLYCIFPLYSLVVSTMNSAASATLPHLRLYLHLQPAYESNFISLSRHSSRLGLSECVLT
jgi:hypothetical protein